MRVGLSLREAYALPGRPLQARRAGEICAGYVSAASTSLSLRCARSQSCVSACLCQSRVGDGRLPRPGMCAWEMSGMATRWGVQRIGRTRPAQLVVAGSGTDLSLAAIVAKRCSRTTFTRADLSSSRYCSPGKCRQCMHLTNRTSRPDE